MKSKFLRILALILVMSSLLSMFAIFATANETGADGETEDTEEQSFTLLYNRTFDEGWDIKNGMKVYDQGSTGTTLFEIDYEETIDQSYNYFWRIELNSSDNDYAQLDLGANQNVGTVVEFDLKSDDICNFNDVINFTTKRIGDDRSDIHFLKVENNKVYLMHGGSANAFTGGSSDPVFELTNSWTTIKMVFDYTYVKYDITEDMTEDEKNNAIAENNKYFLLYLYYGPADGSEELTLWTGKPIEIYGTAGKGIEYFRFQSTGSDPSSEYGTSICIDNMKIYDGVNYIENITKADGYGKLINSGYPISIDIIGGSTAPDASSDLNLALSMKVGVNYFYANRVKSAIATDTYGNAYGAPVKVDGKVMIPLDTVLNYIGAEVYVHPDNTYIDVTTGLNTTYLVVGKDSATVGNEVVSLTAAPAYAIDDNGNAYLVVALNDVDVLFPGYYADYDEMGYIAIANCPNVLNRDKNLDAMISIMKQFVFEYYTPESIYNDVKEYTNFEHPYLLANGEQLEMLYNEYQDLNSRIDTEIEEGSEEYWLWVHYQRIVNTGESAYKRYAKEDADGTYNTFAGVEPDKYDPETGKNLRGKTSLDQDYLDYGGYDPDGGRSDIASRTQYLEQMAFAYVLTKDVKYLQLCYEIAVILGGWTHWGPGHFLNCADSSNDYALYYDWCYQGYVELANAGVKRPNGESYDVSVLAEILARQGVHEGYNSTNKIYDHVSEIVGSGGGYYSERTNNWAAVCVGGMTMAALAILGDVDQTYVDEATYMLSDNFRSLVELGLDIYAPDGSYIEGPGYWNYGTNNFFRMCAALDTATGGNYGLMDCWGMDTTCYYACHTEDNNSKYFPFHDGSVGSQDTSYFFYVAQYFNDATLYDVRLNQINGNVKWATLIDLIYYPREVDIDADAVSLDYYSSNIDLFATRSSWEKDALFTSMIGGKNKVSHGQIDAGDFVYHNGGNIWIYDLGTENYNCAGFWPDNTRYRYYVMKPEGNNTVAISTDPAGVPYGQRLDAEAKAYGWGSNEYGSYVNYDMGNALGSNVSKWERGMMLTNDRKTTVIQDQISFKNVQTVYWFAHYSLSYVDKVEISKDGRTAYMKSEIGTDEHGVKIYQTLRLTLVSNNKTFKFEIMDTYTFIHTTGQEATYTPEKVLELGSVPENSRSNYKKLAVTSGEALNFDIAVVIEMIDTDTVGKKNEIEVGYEFVNMNTWQPSADTRGLKIDEGSTIVRRGVPNVNTHLVQSITKIQDMENKGVLYTDKIKEYYKALTDAYYCVRTLGVDMPAGYEAEIAQLNKYKDEFAAYRTAVTNLQKVQADFASKLMGLG